MDRPKEENPTACSEAVETLAEALFLKMEHLEPTEDGGSGWGGLSERQREFYRLCVKAILVEREAVAQALR
jgi:hypothetical protein